MSLRILKFLLLLIGFVAASSTNSDYNEKIVPIYSKYDGVIKEDKSVNVKRFLTVASVEDIMRVLVGVREILPENSKERLILQNGFYLFHFKARPWECSEFLMTLPEGPEELERNLRLDRETAVRLARKLVNRQEGNLDILRMILKIYSGPESFVNERLDWYNSSILNYTYLLHEACEIGNVGAVEMLLDNGADPFLLAGNSVIGPRWTAINSALKNNNGTDTLRLLLQRIDASRITDNIKTGFIRQILVDYLMSDELKSRKIELLKEFNYI